jgi:hypothetical protein
MLAGVGWGEAVAQTATRDESRSSSPSGKPAAADGSKTAEASGRAMPPDGGDQAGGVPKGGEIIVTGRLPPVQQRPGATEYNVSGLQGTTGSVADLLNTLPSVSVTSDGEVSLRGRTDVEVLIDGRPSASMDRDSRGTTLQSMPGSSVRSVEVVTNPSAGMNSGGASVVNLKLKKNAALGPRASLSADVDHRRRGRVSLDSSYGWEDVKLDLKAGYSETLRIDGLSVVRRYDEAAPGDVALSAILAAYTPTRSRSGDVQTKLRYELSKDTEFGGSFYYTNFSAANIVRFFNSDFDAAGNLLDRYVRVRDARLDKHDVDAKLFLARRGIGADGQLRIEGQYGSGQLRSDRRFSLTPGGASAPVSVTYAGDYQDSSFHRVTADVEASPADRLSLKAGVEWEDADERFRNSFADLPLTAALPSRLVGTPDDFRVARDKIGTYVEAAVRRADWKVQGGLKWRRSRFGLSNGGDPALLTRRFDGLDASLSLEYEWSGGQLSLSWSRLLQLPDAQSLNPTVVIVDDQDRYVGNPALRPQKATRGELAYNSSFHGLDAVARLYYRGTEDNIADVYQAVDDNVIERSKINAGLTQDYGLEAGLSGRLLRGVKFDLSGNVYQAETSFQAFGENVQDSLVTYNAKVALDWSIGARDKLRLDASAAGPSLLVQGRRSGSRAVSLVWQHTVSADLGFTLAAQQFLQNGFTISEIASPTVSTFTRRINETTSIQAGIKLKIK